MTGNEIRMQLILTGRLQYGEAFTKGSTLTLPSKPRSISFLVNDISALFNLVNTQIHHLDMSNNPIEPRS